MKRWIKLLATILAGLLMVGVLGMYLLFNGSALARIWIEFQARDFCRNTYPDLAYEVEEVRYDFKHQGYTVHIGSPLSPDSSFTIYYSFFGKPGYSNYDSMVTRRGNTAQRVSEEYEALVLQRLQQIDEMELVDVRAFLEFGGNAKSPNDPIFTYCLKAEELKLDGTYDPELLGAQSGIFVATIHEETISSQQMAIHLLALREALEEADIPFQAIQLNLRQPPNAAGQYIGKSMLLESFRIGEIYPENLPDRIEAHIDRTPKW